MLKPGGTMVYSTCSIFPSENEKQIYEFLSNQKENKKCQWELLKENHYSPHKGEFDGFYEAQLKKL